tara:strand:+ start:8245 stop:8586 length:342 start_codon:yes stop_codon:yes gene_type:complete
MKSNHITSTIEYASTLRLEHEEPNPAGLPLETVVISVDGKLYRHKSRWEDATPEMELIEQQKEVVLTPLWRELSKKENETVKEEQAYSEFTDWNENRARQEAIAVYEGMSNHK